MPYQPVQINNPGIAPGINALSETVAEWKRKQQEDERLQGYNDAVIQHAKAAGRISQDELNKYNAASLTQKTGIAAGYAAGLHEDLQQQNALSTRALQAAQAQYYLGGGSGGGGAPFVPQTYQLKDPITGKPIALFSRGPHQVDLTPDSSAAGLPAPGTPVYADDGSQIGVWNAKGAITKKTIPDPEKAQRVENMKPAPPAPPEAQTMDKLKNFLKTGPMGPATPIRIASEKEYKLLPSGANYIAPDGSVRKKP